MGGPSVRSAAVPIATLGLFAVLLAAPSVHAGPQVLCAHGDDPPFLRPAGPRPGRCRLADEARPLAAGIVLQGLRWSSATWARGRVRRVGGGPARAATVRVARPVAGCDGGRAWSRLTVVTAAGTVTDILDARCSKRRAFAAFDSGAIAALSDWARARGATANGLGPAASGSACNITRDRTGRRERWNCITAHRWERIRADGTRGACETTVRGHLDDHDRAVLIGTPRCLEVTR